jgi:heat shock protein HslJ
MTAARTLRNPVAGGGIVVALMFVLGGWATGSGSSGSANAELANTYWKLVEVGGKAVPAVPKPREAHFILRPGEQPSVIGSGGCNRMMGGYRVDGDSIAFERMATTQMACVETMDQERAFLAALGATRIWSIRGQVLELRGGDGRVLARFEAQPAK